MTDAYPIGADEPLTEKTYLMLSRIIGETTDPEDAILCSILNLILLGNKGAPLRKAIMDSKLGTDILNDFLGSHILTFDYMMPEIRFKGNAYNCPFSYNPFESLIYQGSQFDPTRCSDT